ncbi:3,4-dihydroxy-2-butanone-4-phosphate synthase [archaeon SCG-AAA382B04]|nr:3,4-dihydroxy-2-butanone-4-phosphate synthase [archaeon SCG-AAA382B04]
MSELKKAIENLKKGKKVLIFDSGEREGETDIVIPVTNVGFEDIVFMRKSGGGLICVTLPYEVAEKLDLPFMADVLQETGFNESEIPYGADSSFSLWVNHKETFTGITDKDRALTARKLGGIHRKVVRGKEIEFDNYFRIPGHVPILKGAEGLLNNRKGHTELSMALAEMAGILPTMVVCEMLDDETGESLSQDKAKVFSKEKDIPFIEGKKIIKKY